MTGARITARLFAEADDYRAQARAAGADSERARAAGDEVLAAAMAAVETAKNSFAGVLERLARDG